MSKVSVSFSLLPLLLALAACGDKPDDTGEPPVVDTETPSTWCADADGYGDPSSSLQAAEPPSGHVEDDLDCDDGDPAIHPGAQELCDEVDSDCDGLVDDDGYDDILFGAQGDDTNGEYAGAAYLLYGGDG